MDTSSTQASTDLSKEADKAGQLQPAALACDCIVAGNDGQVANTLAGILDKPFMVHAHSEPSGDDATQD
jgi:hypothetical protein